jgi:glucosamine-phosphate N-acetyltransferase
MNEIKFSGLLDLLNTYSNHVDKIKKKYLSLLSELTSANYVENYIFFNNVEKIHEFGKIFVGYIGDPLKDDFKIIASGTIIIEPKIIRNGKNVGHIEDIVVSRSHRKNGVSQTILSMLKEYAKENNCYKVILDCDDDVKNVYIKNGFEIKGLQMAQYF